MVKLKAYDLDNHIMYDTGSENIRGLNVEYLRYTNTKDTYNQEIYEGFVVLRKASCLGGNICGNFIGVVEMINGQWWIVNGETKVPLWQEGIELQVLGNKFDDLELLEHGN